MCFYIYIINIPDVDVVFKPVKSVAGNSKQRDTVCQTE